MYSSFPKSPKSLVIYPGISVVLFSEPHHYVELCETKLLKRNHHRFRRISTASIVYATYKKNLYCSLKSLEVLLIDITKECIVPPSM